MGGPSEEVATGIRLDDVDDVELPSTGRYNLIIDGDEDTTFTWSVTNN